MSQTSEKSDQLVHKVVKKSNTYSKTSEQMSETREKCHELVKKSERVVKKFTKVVKKIHNKRRTSGKITQTGEKSDKN